ncbi:MAG: efflux RND transporter permease subunit [Acidobacteria bacterium]|nr:MAG: efflux RND transporter permease subunit [Acidobacteriota bacterium]
MLNAIVSFALRYRGVVIALACSLLGYGIYSLHQAHYNVFPEFAPPQVTIQTEAPGLAPEQVEVLVTRPIENVINGVTGIDALRSQSIQGLSIITVVFHPGSDVYLDRQLVAERLATVAGQLPAGVEPPVMTPLTSSTSLVAVVGLTSKTISLMDQTTAALWTVRQQLLAVPGVASVVVFGAEVQQVQIQFDPEKLVRHNLTVNDVLAAARRATAVRGAGFITTPNQRIVLTTHGQSLTPSEIAGIVLAHSNGVNVRLGDVAQVVNAPAPLIGGASIMGHRGLVLNVSSQYGANTLEVTSGLDKAVAQLGPVLARQGITLSSDIFRPATFIETALSNLRTSLLIGALLIVVVLFLFLFKMRTAVISCTAIPLSLLAAIIIMEHLGASINTMTLGGLAIAIGEVVDDAVIDVENIYRRLRENRRSSQPRPAFPVILDASLEVRSAVVYATFAVVLVFFPVLTMSGLAGKLFSPLGEAYIWSILASLVVALTVTPALCSLLLTGRDLTPQEPPLVRWLEVIYRRVLIGVERAPGMVLMAVAAAVIAGAAILPSLRASFLPEFRENHFIVHIWTVPGTSIEQSLSLGKRITGALLKIPNLRMVAQRAGRAVLSEDTWGTHYSEFEVDFKPSSMTGEQEAARIREALGPFPGIGSSVESFFRERMEETLTGYTAEVAVNIFGNNLSTLDQEGQQVAAVLGKVPCAADVHLQSPPGMPGVTVQLRKDTLARWGFDPVDVLDAVQTAFEGDTVGQIYQGNRVSDVSVILPDSDRSSVDEIGDLPLRSPNGNYVNLRDLADIYERSGRYVVLHEGAQRVQTITCNVRGRSVPSFVAEAQREVDRMPLPRGTVVEFGGTAAAQAQSRRDLLIHSALAGLGIILLLSVVMGNYRNLLLVLVNLPFALVGGILAAWITGGVLSLGSMVGFVTLFGITVRNSIMMISHFQHLVSVEGMDWGLEAAMRGASERLAPILMTALVTGLGLLPLALASGSAGREIEGPMAIVILGGLFTSTVLNLLVLPTLSLRYGKFGNSSMGAGGQGQ